MRIGRSCGATLALLLLAAPGAHAADGEWAELEAELAQVLDRVGIAPPIAASPAVGDAGPAGLAARLDAVLAQGSFHHAPTGGSTATLSPGTSGDPPVPEPVLRALRLIAGTLHRAARTEDAPAVHALRSALRAQLRELRLVLAKRSRSVHLVSASTNSVAAASAPANDECTSASIIGTGSHPGTTIGATNDGSASLGASSGAPDAWFLFSASTAGHFVFDTLGSSYDTVLSLHSGCPGTTANELRSNDDHTGLQSQVSISTTDPQRIWVRVSGFGGGAGSFALNVNEARLIAGTVTDSATQEPLEDVSILIGDEQPSIVGVTSTASDGSFAFPVTDGTYYAAAQINTHIDEMYDDFPCPAGGELCFFLDATPILVGPGLDSSGIDFALDPAAIVSGTVTETPSSQPIDGAIVTLFDEQGGPLLGGQTAPDGTYTIGGFLPGTVYASAGAGNHLHELYDEISCKTGCDPTTGTPIALVAGENRTGVNFTLELGGAVTGAVTRALDGSPLEGVWVQLYDGASFVKSERVEVDGRYHVGGLATGTYFARTAQSPLPNELYDGVPCDPTCVPSTGTPIEVVEGSTTSGIDFALGPDNPPGLLSGTVTDATTGLPLAGVPVTLHDHLGRPLAVTSSLADGGYSFAGLAPGTFHLEAGATESHAAQLPGGLPFGLDVLAAVGVTITSSSGSVVDFALWPLGVCGFPEEVQLVAVAVDAAAEVAACSSIVAGPGVEVGGAGRLELRAGGTVSLSDGFRVASGGRLAVASGSVLPPPVGTLAYEEDFDDGFALGWDTSSGATDLWRLAADCSSPRPPASPALAFGRPAPDCDYDLGTAVPIGWARSPVLDLSAATSALLHLEHRWETEPDTLFDLKRVEVSDDGGFTWTPVLTIATASSEDFVGHEIDVTAWATAQFRLRFAFDSFDDILNHFAGWAIDRVWITTD
jgi:hypothetical protein